MTIIIWFHVIHVIMSKRIFKTKIRNDFHSSPLQFCMLLFFHENHGFSMQDLRDAVAILAQLAGIARRQWWDLHFYKRRYGYFVTAIPYISFCCLKCLCLKRRTSLSVMHALQFELAWGKGVNLRAQDDFVFKLDEQYCKSLILIENCWLICRFRRVNAWTHSLVTCT